MTAFAPPDPATRDADLPVPATTPSWRDRLPHLPGWAEQLRERAPDVSASLIGRWVLLVLGVLFFVAGLTGGCLYLLSLL